MTWAGVHWFAGTTRALDPEQILDVLAEWLRLSVVARPRGGYGYTFSASVGGASVYWTPNREDVFVVLPGDECEQLGVVGVASVASLLDLEPSSRLDVAWDCMGFTPATVAAAFAAGDVVTRIHRKPTASTKPGRVPGLEEIRGHDGDTTYLGSRSSGRFLRVYDRRGPTRVELELKEDRALVLWRELLAHVEGEWSSVCLGHLRDFVDFRAADSDTNQTRRTLLPWWAEFVSGAERLALVVPREPKGLEQTRRWLKQAVSPALALVLDASPDPQEMLSQLYEYGRTRYRSRADRVALLDAERLRLELNAAD